MRTSTAPFLARPTAICIQAFLVFVTGAALGHADVVTHRTLDDKLGLVLKRVGELVFTFPGDGVRGAPLRYMDNGETIIDLNTGLMWEKEVPGPAGRRNCLVALHSVDARCALAEATGDWIDRVNAEGGFGYAGYSDWRLTNAKELHSILDYGRCRSTAAASCVDFAAIHPAFGPTATDDSYFSSTSQLHNAAEQKAWVVPFTPNGVTGAAPDVSRYVRAVRDAR